MRKESSNLCTKCWENVFALVGEDLGVAACLAGVVLELERDEVAV